MRHCKAETHSTMLCSSILNHPPPEGPYKPWLTIFTDHWRPVLQHNMSVKDVSMLIVVCSKRSTETLTSNPEHDDKVNNTIF